MANATDYGTSLFLAILPTADTIQAQRTSLANNQLIAGVRMLQKGRNLDAIPLFKKALAMDSSSIDAYNYLGNTYLKLNKSADAIATFKKLVAMKPFDSDALTTLGNAYAQDKQWGNAAIQFKKAIGLSPGNTTALYSLGQSNLLDKKYSEALTVFQQVTRLTPKDPNGYFALGQVYNKLGKYDTAITNLNKAIDLKHGVDFPQAVNELGYAYAGKGDDLSLQRTITKLKTMDSSLATQLQTNTVKPKMTSGNFGTYNTFYPSLGPHTALSVMTLTDPDQTLSKPNASKSFTMQFQFNTSMDPASVQSPANWRITKANGGKAGFYNYGYTPNPQQEAHAPLVQSVAYDIKKQLATVTFSLTQNATADAVIDPSHIVFTFSGKDINGKMMDPTANSFDQIGGVFGAPAVSFFG